MDTLRILLVEDDCSFRDRFAEMAQEAGLVVDLAETSDETLTLLTNQTFALVVVSEPVCGSFDSLVLLERITAEHAGCGLILLTAAKDHPRFVSVRQQGVCHCIGKPIEPELLVHLLQLHVEQRRLNDENFELRAMAGLFQTSQALTSCLDPVAVSQLIVESLAGELGASRAIGFLKDGDRLDCLASQGGDSHFTPLFTEQLGVLVFQQVSRSMRPVRLLLPCQYHGPEQLDLREALLVPLHLHATLLGVVVLFNNPGQLLPPSFNDRSVIFLQEHGARALENAVKFTATRDLLYIDELSGLFNYRYLRIALEREIKRADRYATQLTVMFLDLDNFKKVNDTYGHMVGSGVLKELGGLLKQSLREVDVVIRYGGDEYTIILVETGPEPAKRVGERIRRQIEAHPFLESDGHRIAVTASIGFACYPDDTTGMQELLSMADRAMYVGKASGRNCVFRVASPLAGAGRTNKEQG